MNLMTIKNKYSNCLNHMKLTPENRLQSVCVGGGACTHARTVSILVTALRCDLICIFLYYKMFADFINPDDGGRGSLGNFVS